MNVQDRTHDAWRDAREETQYHHVTVEIVVRREILIADGMTYVVMRVVDMYTNFGYRRIVWTCKGIELLGTELLRTVASQQIALEEDTDFRHHRHTDAVVGSCYLDCCN